MPTKVAYERVNLADIETSSEEDDYGDLFAKERRQGHGKSRPLRKLSKKKGRGTFTGSLCCKGICLVSSVLAILGLLAGAALYMDPEGSFMDLMSGNSTNSTSFMTSLTGPSLTNTTMDTNTTMVDTSTGVDTNMENSDTKTSVTVKAGHAANESVETTEVDSQETEAKEKEAGLTSDSQADMLRSLSTPGLH